MGKNVIAFVTYQEQPAITADDALLKKPLEKLGIEVIGIPWDREDIDWTVFDAVVVRLLLGLFPSSGTFFVLVKTLDSQKVYLINECDILLWNAEKTYLRDLMAMGAIIVPTVYAFQGSHISIADVLEQKGWKRAAVKPTISGTSLHTWVTSQSTLKFDQQKLDGLLSERSMMLQEYLPEIETEGELSLVYFDGEYSHAVKKMPRPGDFRVQSNFGGTWAGIEPDAEIRRQADAIIRFSNRATAYARVDGVVRGGQFLLMELETIEPHLFLGSNQEAPGRFARAIQSRLRNS